MEGPTGEAEAAGPLGRKPFLPLTNGEKWILECGGTQGVQPSGQVAPFLRTTSRPRLHLPALPLPLLRLPGLS